MNSLNRILIRIYYIIVLHKSRVRSHIRFFRLPARTVAKDGNRRFIISAEWEFFYECYTLFQGRCLRRKKVMQASGGGLRPAVMILRYRRPRTAPGQPFDVVSLRHKAGPEKAGPGKASLRRSLRRIEITTAPSKF